MPLPAEQVVSVSMPAAHLATVLRALEEMPFRVAAPVLAGLRPQLVALENPPPAPPEPGA